MWTSTLHIIGSGLYPLARGKAKYFQKGPVSSGARSGNVGRTMGMRLLSARIDQTQGQLLLPARRCEVQFADVAIRALDTEHGALGYGLSYGLLADDTLIGECTRDFYRHFFTGSRLAEIDHHRHERSDRYPFIALVDVAVSEPAFAEIRLPVHGTLGRILDVVMVGGPCSMRADVLGDDGRQVRTTPHGSVDTHLDLPRADESVDCGLPWACLPSLLPRRRGLPGRILRQ